MRILIYGAGVTGSFYAARLHEAGQEVALLARGPRLADLGEHGVVLEDYATGQRTVSRVPIVERLSPEEAYDWVLVLMRRNQIPAILPMLAANRHTPNVLFMTNNAAGPGLMTEALGRERVLLGFPGMGGVRQGAVVRYIAGPRPKVTLGELEGHVSPRLLYLAEVLNEAGFQAEISSNMDAWLKTHVALVSPIANALYLAGGSNYRLASTPDGVVLLVRAVREGLQVLRALDIPITPHKFRLLARVPEPLLVRWVTRLLQNPAAEVALAGHANAAPDEMKQIADEFQALARAVSVPTPAINHLYRYLDPAIAPVPEGSAEMPLDWSGVQRAVGGAAVLAGLLGLGWWYRRR